MLRDRRSTIIHEPRPVFVIGSYRSGTSILCWCLGQHPNLVGLPETGWIWRYSLGLPELYASASVNWEFSHIGALGLDEAQFFRHMGKAADEFVQSTNPILLARPREDPVFRRRRSANDPKTRWVDATPENSYYVWPLWRMFPEARFIHLLRDPDAVARSLMRFSRVGGAARDFGRPQAYYAWLRLVRASVAAEGGLGSARVRRVLYQDLVKDPEGTLRACLDFLEEPWAPACVEPMSRRINSSGDHGLAPASERSPVRIERIAGEYFERLLAEGQLAGEGDPKALEGLERIFRTQVPPTGGLLRQVGFRMRVFFGKVRNRLPLLAPSE
jgi:hypothetical protein